MSTGEESNVSDEQIKEALKTVKSRKGRPALSAEEKTRRQEADKAERDRRKAQRDAEKLAKKATVAKAPVHMKKVESAAARLPSISEKAKETVESILNAFDGTETTAIIAHVGHRLRTLATLKAQEVQLTEGQLVRIDSHESRFNGQVARVTDARRIRCYVEPLSAPGRSEYLFNSQVTPVDSSEIQEPSTGVVATTDALTTSDEPFTAVG